MHGTSNLLSYNEELMSRPKGGRSVQLRGTAFESERLQHFPYMDLFSSGAECCFHSQSTTLGIPVFTL